MSKRSLREELEIILGKDLAPSAAKLIRDHLVEQAAALEAESRVELEEAVSFPDLRISAHDVQQAYARKLRAEERRSVAYWLVEEFPS